MDRSIFLIFLSIAFVIVGQACLKVGMNSVGEVSFGNSRGIVESIKKVALTPLVPFGLFLYVIAALVWLIVLSKVDLSFAYPMMSLSYVGILLVSHFLLGENVTPLRWIGVAVICAGVILLSRS